MTASEVKISTKVGTFHTPIQLIARSPLFTVLTVESTTNLTYQTVMRSCYKPGKILISNLWWETKVARRAMHWETEAF